ncbi:hypothetical protein BX600DRAFT_382509 [Xylariales sp. PMI_506]|nr:hypothetical protein BX600DRAFT_382509 [Xylariales sp. PMI_506]
MEEYDGSSRIDDFIAKHYFHTPQQECNPPSPPQSEEYDDAVEQERQFGFWVKQLEASKPAEFLLDKPRPAALPGNTSIQHLAIPKEISTRIQKFCDRDHVNEFSVLLAAFRVAHYRLTGACDATIGTVTGVGRSSQQETKHMIGSMANIKCIRTNINGTESFAEVVRQVHLTYMDALANRMISFEQIVTKLLPQREGEFSRHPLVQILFSVDSRTEYQNKVHGYQDLQAEQFFMARASPFDLELYFVQNQDDDSFQGQVLFSTDLYKSETIKNMLSIFQEVLERGLLDNGTPVASLDLFSSQDSTTFRDLGLLEAPKTPYPRESSIVDIFRQQVALTPDRVAVKQEMVGSDLTYTALDQQSDALASWLICQSLTPETVVGVLAPRSCQTIVAFMGILKANLAYLPFDTKMPPGRMETILSSIDGQTIILVGSQVRIPSIKGSNAQMFRIRDILDGQNSSSASESVSSATIPPLNELRRPSATSLAYVMFTSGSTGQPKGVMVEHRGIVRLVKDNIMAECLPTGGYTVMAHLTSIAFDNSTWEIYAALLNGGTLICIDNTTVLDPSAMERVFASNNVNAAMFTPALLKQHLIAKSASISQLNMLCVQGERASPEDMITAQRLMGPGGMVINAYGPTENTVTSTFFVMPQQIENFSAINGIPIGRTISNSGAYVMDSEQQLVPLGVIGELVVTGDGLARGYTDPQRNAGRFITATIMGQSVRAYRTGDYVRFRPVDGELEFFGRIDGQVKIRGNRVELGEIEHVVRSHDYVADAAVVVASAGRESDNNADPRLLGYVTISDIKPGSTEESHLLETWLDHWDAETYTPMDQTELNGKNDPAHEIGRDFIGWTSTYDGNQIPRTEMNEWLDETIGTIIDGGSVGHVLEIGTGSGMILFNLSQSTAAALESYVGLEPSRRAVDFITKTAKRIPALEQKVTMHQATAGDIDQLTLSSKPDTVVLNSVVQYFPSQDYLLRVIQSLIKLGAKTLFLGDIRSYALHREYLASRALFIAGEAKLTKSEFRQIMSDIGKAESELLIDPTFFIGLAHSVPSIRHVEILPKRMQATNELSCYRYTAILHIDLEVNQAQTSQVHEVNSDVWVDYTAQKLDRQQLGNLLWQQNSLSSPIVAISNIPNSKTIFERSVLDFLDEDDSDDSSDGGFWISRARQSAEERRSLSVVDTVRLAEQAGWGVEISWARQNSQHGGFDAVFHRYHCQIGSGQRSPTRVKFRFPTDEGDRPYYSLCSQPLQRQLRQKVRKELYEILKYKLPYYMVPYLIVFLDEMPLNQNGKLDRQALASMHERSGPNRYHQPLTQAFQRQPKSDTEIQLQQIWSHVLGLDQSSINRQDGFFHLGGDSIAAMTVASQARKVGINLAVTDIFRHSVLHDLASHIDREVSTGEEESSHGAIAPFSLLGDRSSRLDLISFFRDIHIRYNLGPGSILDAYPCTPLQEGLIYLTSKRPGDYVRQAVMELSPEVVEDKLYRAWEVVVQAAPILRTRVVQHHELGLLQLVLDEKMRWVETEGQGLDTYLNTDKGRPMDLGQPLSRFALIRDNETKRPKWFVWTAHHALYDGWSLQLIQASLYRAYRNESIEVGTQFQAFISYVKELDHSMATEYWQRVLADYCSSPFPSPPRSLDHPTTDTAIDYQLSQPPSNSIGNNCSGITTSMLIRAAWALVLGQMANSDDVVYGITLYGRNAPVPDLDKMMAPAIATVPVRVRVTKDQSCLEYLETVQREATEMIPFEQTGLSRIAKTCTGGQRACQFQTQLVIQPHDDISSAASRCPFGKWQDGSEAQGSFTTYALTIELHLHPDKITAIAMFDSRVIQSWVVRKMLRQLEFLMLQLAQASPSEMLSEIRMMLPEDLEKIWKWNAAVPTPVDRCVHQIIESKTQDQLDFPAICAWDGELTYDQLDQLATRLSGKLSHLGVASGVLVPLCFEKSMYTVIAILGVLKAGGGFVLLDPSLPEQRLQHIVRQVEGSLIITSPSNKDLSSRLSETVITLSGDLFAEEEAPYLTVRGNPQPLSSSILYVVFTSGSTGTPKGVMITHSNMASALHHQGGLMGLTSGSRLYDFASYSFDVSISNLFTTLAAGGCLCIPNENDRKGNLEQSILTLRANALDLTPSVARLLSSAGLSLIRSLTLGGEPLRTTDVEPWWGSVHGIRNAYGPSECTPTSTINAKASSPEEMAAHIGQGAGLVTWVVNPDNHNELLPPGCIGELLLEGPLVGLGYLGDEDKTRAAFIKDPPWLNQGIDGCQPGRSGRLYKTGDLVRYNDDKDGTLTFVGRKDEQVKIRGQRVELGEIEQILRSHDCVDDAFVMLQQPEDDDDRQDAWITSFVTVQPSRYLGSETEQDMGPNGNDEEARRQVQTWESQFDSDTYASLEKVQPKEIGRDFVGWTSMYDGSQIANAEMKEWLDDTMETIRNIGCTPRDVLEIGTGSGMILFNLAEEFQSYVGLEPSERAVDFSTKAAKSIPTLAGKVQIIKATAADVTHLAMPNQPNLVILNSVIQYFPSQEYLLQVIQSLIRLGSVKTIVFGDVRSYALHKDFLAMRAIKIAGEGAGRRELRRIMENLERSESELLVDPGFFTGLQERLPGYGIQHIEIRPKVMKAVNELSCYRYFAVIHMDLRHPQQQQPQPIHEIDQDRWVDYAAQGLNYELLLHLLNSSTTSNDQIAISNIPNSKNILARDVVDALENQEVETEPARNIFDDVRRSAQHGHSLSAVDLTELAQRTGHQVEISWARQYSQRGGFDAVFHRLGANGGSGGSRSRFRFPTDHHGRSYRLLSSQPLRRQTEARIQEQLGLLLRDQLPSYMVPRIVTILDKFPVNRNGKIDQRKLAESIESTQVMVGQELKKRPPTTKKEIEMRRIWSQVLGLEASSIGMDDGFIQLGGNSLGAMKVVTMARQAGIEITVADLFRHRTTSIKRLLDLQSCDQAFTPESDTLDLMAEISRHDARVADIQAKASVTRKNHWAEDIEGSSNNLLTVLLTGASGFIGTQILRQLLEQGQVGRVIAIVRGTSPEEARQRTIHAARKALWWTEFHQEALEVWQGDLSLPRLGLAPKNWDLLADGTTVDVVIHNGASVHFIKSYRALEAANVGSTAEMLSLAAASPHMRFVYVSSARHQDPEEEREQDVARELVSGGHGGGYMQTKFVAEALVRRAALRASPPDRWNNNRFAVVSPGLVIGTPTEGVANADDWIWRVAAACIRVGMYDVDDCERWIPMSDSAVTATTIIDAALGFSTSSIVTQVKGGMSFSEFWATLRMVGFQLEPKSSQECTAAIRKDMETSGETHPLWTLADTLSSLEKGEKALWSKTWYQGSISQTRLKVAISKSVEVLSRVGFLPLPVRGMTDNTQSETLELGAFSRSGI